VIHTNSLSDNQLNRAGFTVLLGVSMFGGVILMFFGIFMLGYAVYAWKEGEVRMGSKGLSPYTPSREDSPGAFYLGVLLYLSAGLWMVIYGLMILTGHAAPIPLN